MPRIKEEGLQKHTLLLYEGDYEKLREVYPETGAALIIRRIVRALVKQIETNGGPVDMQVEIKL